MEDKTENINYSKIIITVLAVLLVFAVCFGIYFAVMKEPAVPANANVDLADSNAEYAYTEFDPNAPSTPDSAISSALPDLSAEQIQEFQKQLEEAGATIDTLKKSNEEYEVKKAEQEAAIKKLEEEKRITEEKLPPVLAHDSIYGAYNGISQLATLEYNYTVNFKIDPEGNFATKVERLYIVSGKVKLGVDYDDATKAIKIDDYNKTVTVTIPKAFIISNELDEKTIECFELKQGWFANPDDVFTRNAYKARDAAEKEIVDNDMLKQAQRLAGIQIQEQLEKVTSKSAYKLVIEYAK
jgi:hypothetical protein